MKKILFALLISLFLIPGVNAEQNWAQYVTNYPSQLYFRNCSGSDCYTNGSTIGSTQYQFNFTNDGNTYYYRESNNISISATGNGAMVIFGFTPVIPDNLYSLTAYMCSNMSLSTTNINYDYYFGPEWASVATRTGPTVNKAYFTGTEIDNIPFVNPTNETYVMYNHCYSRTFIFDPIEQSRFIGISLKGNGVASSGTIAFIGYDLEYLGSSGVAASDISYIVKNSGLATATSIEEVNESIDEVKQELNNVSNSIDNLNDSITSEEGPTNLGALDNSAGWLPAGPIDSILNLPLSLFNSLLTAISSTCQPLQITFPFVDFDYSLPCISTIYSKINGLNSIVDFVGLVVGVLILYYYFIHLYNWVDKKLTMQYNSEWGGI